MALKIEFKKILVFIFSSIFVLALSSCSSNSPKGLSEAENLYNDAKKYMDDNRYLLATEKLNTLKTQYPYSVFAKKGELLIAEIQFKQENYPEAAASYIAFRDLHPTYEEMPYVVWMIAESYYQQLPPTFDRDLTPGIDAKKYYGELILTYPNSSNREDAENKVKEIDKMLLAQELYIADFYFRTDVFDGAIFRYKNIMERFPSDGNVLSVAPARIIKSLLELKKFSDCVAESEKFLALELEKKSQNDIKKFEQECKRKI